MSLINISIDLTAIKERCPDKIKQAANGRKYINLCVSGRKEVSLYGDTHTVFASQTREERQANAPVIFVGTGKEFVAQAVTAEAVEAMPVTGSNDDLPF
jgi:hypothetical protein